jgi:ureidoglycolate hydrolase
MEIMTLTRFITHTQQAICHRHKVTHQSVFANQKMNDFFVTKSGVTVYDI